MTKLSGRFIDLSAYGPYNFSGIPGTVISALTPETPEHILPDDALEGLSNKYDKVVVFLLDAFGWESFLEARKRNDFLNGLCGKGNVLKLATQFPSATACNITTLNTSLGVADHGVYEWFYYEPKVGEIISPLLYSYGDGIKDRDSLKKDLSVKPSDIYPAQTLYGRLLQHGVMSYTFQSVDYAVSTYSDVVFRGAQRYGYITPAGGLVNLADAVVDKPKKAYYYYYFDQIDSLSHVYGPGSRELKAEIDAFFYMLEDAFWNEVKNKVDRTLFILTADHGQIAINPKKCVYLNLEFPDIVGRIKKSKSGRPLEPAGSCRDMFLYIEEGWLDETLELLSGKLKDTALVIKTRELIDDGYFLQKHVSEALAGRLGNLVVLPYEGESVWWYEKDRFEIDLLGHHGGLTPQEMEIPFLAWDL